MFVREVGSRLSAGVRTVATFQKAVSINITFSDRDSVFQGIDFTGAGVHRGITGM